MTKIINSANPGQLDSYQEYQLYNALDCCVTAEVWKARQDHWSQNTWQIYLHGKDIQAPALEMQLRGILLDSVAVSEECARLSEEIRDLEDYFDALMLAGYGQKVNWKSPAQVKKMLNDMGWTTKSTERDDLEKLTAHFYAEPVINVILALRDRSKLYDVLAKSKRKRTGRFHAAFKVPGTGTGRLSSSKDSFGEGHNLQNINDRTRRVFIPDPGYKMAYIDLEQAESRAVAYLAAAVSGKTNYLEACESGDLHTTVCQMVWQELEWTDDPKQNKEVAKQIFYRDWDYRYMAKRGGHGTNYYGTAQTMAKHLKIPKAMMQDFQDRYLTRFPEIREWWNQIMIDLMTDGWLMTPFGRFRRFFGRPDDDATIRKAIAFEPQSLVADILNTGLLRIWQTLPQVQLLAQVHDAVLIQYPQEAENEIIPQVQSLLEIPIAVGPRTMTIPSEASVGWNWGHFDEDDNFHGLREWDGTDDRERPTQRSLLETRL